MWVSICFDPLGTASLFMVGLTEENAKCCGMGGLMMFTDQKVSITMGKERVQEARDTVASGLVTACPACLDQFRRLADGFNTYEITDIVLKAL